MRSTLRSQHIISHVHVVTIPVSCPNFNRKVSSAQAERKTRENTTWTKHYPETNIVDCDSITYQYVTVTGFIFHMFTTKTTPKAVEKKAPKSFMQNVRAMFCTFGNARPHEAPVTFTFCMVSNNSLTCCGYFYKTKKKKHCIFFRN